MEMQSIWSSTENFLPREPLKGDLTTDAAVIGGGMAGILTAYFLKQHGVEPVVLEPLAADKQGIQRQRSLHSMA